MFRFLLGIFFFISTTHVAWANCDLNHSVTGVKYKVTAIKADQQSVITRNVFLWRNGKQVAHEYMDTRITEIWEQMSNGKLRMVRYFDKHERGIEYQPNEIKAAHNENGWSLKKQLISNTLLNSMRLVKTQGKGCNRVETYSLKQGSTIIRVQWLAHPRLIKSYSEITPRVKLEWRLVETVSNNQDIKNIFTTRSNYQTTDYTDIGDNESDPFLLKMINLGHIEHGASGFYDAHGHAIKGGHSH